MDDNINSQAAILAHRLIDLANAADTVIGRGHVVDAYYGSYESRIPKGRFNAQTLSDWLDDLADEAHSQRDPLNGTRFVDIAATARSLSVFLRLTIDDKVLPYRQAVEAVLGTDLIVPSESELSGIQAELQDSLDEAGARGNWPTNLHEWQRTNSVGASEYLANLERKADDYKARLLGDVLRYVVGIEAGADVIAQSRVVYKLAETDEAWSAYHHYKGHSFSVVELNTNRPFNRVNAAPFASHEVYPGHHTQALIREYLYRRGELGIEATLSVLNTPSNVLAEGIGDYARNLLDLDLGGSERVAFLFDHLITHWRHRLGVALHEGLLSEIDASTELARRTGLSKDAAARAIRFAVEWKYYFPSYVVGLYHVQGLIARRGKKVLRELYTRDSLTGL